MPTVENIILRKLGYLDRYLRDLHEYAKLADAERHAAHYAIERLLQLLCESASDIGLQRLKAAGETLPASYRETFRALQRLHLMAPALADELILACGMRNLLTHMYDEIDLSQVIAAIEPALDLYERFAHWTRIWLDRMDDVPAQAKPLPREH